LTEGLDVPEGDAFPVDPGDVERTADRTLWKARPFAANHHPEMRLVQQCRFLDKQRWRLCLGRARCCDQHKSFRGLNCKA
jgi:hypothetical protein